MDNQKRQQRKRIPITLAGSYLSRGTQKPPQAPPPNPPKQKPPELPDCPHGVKVTQKDWDTYQRVYEGHCFLNKATDEAEPYPYFANDCPECNPTCMHGEQLSADEIKFAKEFGMRFCNECPACTGSTSQKDWDELLARMGFAKDRGISPAVHYVPTREGGVVPLGQAKNLVNVGGIEELDEVDASRDVSRSDLPARNTGIRMHEIEGE